jgi:putative oxidoreductase
MNNLLRVFHHPQAAMVLLRITLAVLMLFHGWAKISKGWAASNRW